MLSPEIEAFVLESVIPALYLQRAAGKLKTSAERETARAVYEPMLVRARSPESPLQALEDEKRAKVWKIAEQCADLFQRSSSCVEGRNAQLALRYHRLRKLSSKKLAALTVIHNFHLTRPDGTTAAERFFGRKPDVLYSWLLDRLEVPRRPRARRSKPVRKSVE